ncbi:creatininase family protein [Shimwellia blattae]|uniref:Putative creatinase n=1 Tax=Shimwellia blattae (strain ATCC 29907 / DSM 4481 / JCM 1650 / NBRC 105725 / CDC 9005-74) TaxID=630626 RepID=I2B5U2_SHIBC|nr:creatininase family protein [Shimwellia blattae]AFJ45896.1 putative creatinase [Shimwellia blattae DSM 4481 = NBRC 105725]GAB81656.1 putative creatinine amidohydrolase [Shimwellia blattae DSM 4481 = NBRC 105725]VDY63374.1 Creatinine amidohydrolase [Shimwellia blattae]VEC21206.1 Creatinine amidohydrolase [Shimwellia blattae]
MDICATNWFQLEAYLKQDDRVILPLGSTEQHAWLSLCTDYILASRLAGEVGELARVAVYPGLPFGMAPYFCAYPGTINLQPDTYNRLLSDILTSLYTSGFRRIFLINGHGGNSPVQAQIHNWLNQHPDARVQLHNWWSAPHTLRLVRHYAQNASHASWMENFPWTRIPGVTPPAHEKPALDVARLSQLPASAVREYIGDGNYGGHYQRSDDDMQAIWQTARQETLQLLEHGWG